jgi:hypothetical protein
VKSLRPLPIVFLSLVPIFFVACAKNEVTASASGGRAAYCAASVPASPIAGTTGSARVFEFDPMVSSGNTALSPGATNLDAFATSATLTNLQGYGVLRGSFVYVVSDRCPAANGEPEYGAYSASNDFRYAHTDDRFAETMNYHYGNEYRAELDASGALYPTPTFQMIANCDLEDNAYYHQKIVGGTLVDYVCMGRPSNYSTTNFSDDAGVVIHELQHGTTGNAYSAVEDFNKLDYDEAGAINEAVSDFTALMQAEPDISAPFSAFEFSRWALGQFFGSSLMRGAAKCPAWTPDYPNCASFNKSSAGFSADSRRISFAYPDGLGWPYSGPSTSATLRTVWTGSAGFEEIHQTAPIITGALYDAYQGIKTVYGDATTARRKMLRLLMETIKILPKASAADPSPVTMPKFATDLLATMNGALTATFSVAAKAAITTAMSDRGLTGIPAVADGWASAGNSSGEAAHPGVFFYETTAVGVRNYRMRAAEKGAVWFDLVNSDNDSVAAPLLKVVITGAGGKVRFSSSLNAGYVNSTTAFVRYGKINGSSYVAAVNDSGTAAKNTLMTTGYFGGTSLYGVNTDTALYVDVDSTASGQSFTFEVEVTPANKTTTSSSASFAVTVQ